MSFDYFNSAAAVVDRPQKKMEGSASGLWRTDHPTLNEAGKIVKGGMWGPQQKWWKSPAFIKALVGGYGAGKTLIAGKRLIALALENHGIPVAGVSPTFTLARRTMIPTIRELLIGKQSIYGRQAFWWRYHASHHEFHIRFRGRTGLIQIYSGEHPDALKGPNLAAVAIDEPFIQDVEVFKQMLARVRHPDAVHKEIGLTGTPEQLNWGYDLCIGNQIDGIDLDPEKLKTELITASSRENKALDPGYVQRLEGAYSGKAAAAYVDGQFANLSTGMVFYGFSSDNISDLPVPLNGVEWGAGMDFNVNPMSATVFWKAGSHMHFVDEFELPNADTEYLCSVLREKYGEKIKTIYPDASGAARKSAAPQGKSDFWYIKQAGYDISANSENPRIRDSYNAVNGKLAPKTGPLTLTISPSCKKLIKYLSIYSHELLNKQKAMSHLLDAFRYPITYLFPIVRESITVSKLSGT